MKKQTKIILSIIVTLIFSISAVQSAEANGVRVSSKYDNGKYIITLTSQEAGKGIKIAGKSITNGKTVNISYSLVNSSTLKDSIDINEYSVLAPFRVITTNKDNINSRPFKDIINTEYDEYIRHIHDIGITNGFSDGTFKPSNTLTRAEAAVMLASALHLSTADMSDTKFKDVNKHWAKKYINAVLKKGIMTGYAANNTFRPDNKITIAEVCTIMSKSFSFKTKTKGIYQKLKTNQWYSGYVQNIFNLKILTPQDSIYKSFNETTNISRGNFTMMLSRALSTY